MTRSATGPGPRDPRRLVRGPWSEALSAHVGRRVRLVRTEAGTAVDRERGPVSMLSEASLEELRQRAGRDERVDPRVFSALAAASGVQGEAHRAAPNRSFLQDEEALPAITDAGRVMTDQLTSSSEFLWPGSLRAWGAVLE